MSDTVTGLRRKIGGATDLASVVRTMKAMAASAIGQYENAARALDDYYSTVQLGLVACMRGSGASAVALSPSTERPGAIGAIVFGSDQGLVGQFNEQMVDFVQQTLRDLPGEKRIWAIGERLRSRFADTDLQPAGRFSLPNSIHAITPLVGQVLGEMEAQRERGQIAEVYLFYHRPETGATHAPVSLRLLPLDEMWRHEVLSMPWPTHLLPEALNDRAKTLAAVVREYLFVALFRACAESLASENASRLAAMQRAEQNIDELLEDLNRTFHRLRQSSIDEELFDVVSGFEALGAEGRSRS